MRPILTAFALLGITLGLPAHAAPTPPFAPAPDGSVTIYRHATLIDGTGAPARPDMAVITDGDRIKAVLPDADLTPETLASSMQVDLGGKYLLPGLVDSHEHLATPPDLPRARALMRRDLYGGITSVRIMADDLRAIAELAREAREGEIAGPDLAFAALVAGPEFFADPRVAAASRGFALGTAPWMQAIDAATDIPLAIARAKGTGATAIKIYAELPADLIAKLTAEAHRQGMKVWAHGMVFPTKPVDVIAAGPDVISHTCYLAYQLSDPAPAHYRDRFPVDYPAFANGDNPQMTALFAQMRDRGILLDPTLRVYAEGDKRAAQSQGKPGAKPYHCNLDLAARLTNQAWRAGVTLSTGTDGATPRTDPWPALYDELELLVTRAGMPPAQVIRSATLVGAMTLGRASETGSIEPGKLADMIVLASDPIADIRNMRSITTIVKRGHRFARRAFTPITAREMPDND